MAAARESISPIIRNVQSRRLSLELCQKIGNHLLSPNRNSNSNINNESKSHSPSQYFQSQQQVSHHPSQHLQRSPLASRVIDRHNYRRGSSGCIPAISPTVLFKSLHEQDDDADDDKENNNNNLLEERYQSQQQQQQPLQRSPLASRVINRHNYRRGSSGCISAAFSPTALFKSLQQQQDDQHNNNNLLEEESLSSAAAFVSPNRNINNNRRRSSLAAILQSPSSLFEKSSSKPTNLNCNVNNITDIPILSLPKIGIVPASPTPDCPDGLDLSINELLGKGSFGKVFSGIYKGKEIAVKIIKTTTTKNSNSVKSEQNVLQLLPHPNIARIYEIIQPNGADQAFIIMERLKNGNLHTMLNDFSIYLNGHHCIHFSIEIASALSYCHSNGILHLDVKPSNILMDFQNHCKLSDFGNSKMKQDLMLNDVDDTNNNNKNQNNNGNGKFTKLDGTVAYIAPECFRGINPSDKCDVFSFGITMWQILTRQTPYQGESEHSIIYKVVAQSMRPATSKACEQDKFQSSEVLEQYIKLFESCWHQCPEVRPDMTAVNQFLLDLQEVDEHGF